MEAPETPKKKKNHGAPKRFRTIEGVRRFVANVLNRLDTEDLETDRARVMFYGAKILSELIDHSQLETRIRALEEKSVAPQEAVQ